MRTASVISWLTNASPELESLPNDAARKEVTRDADRLSRTRLRRFLSFAVSMAIMLPFIICGFRFPSAIRPSWFTPALDYGASIVLISLLSGAAGLIEVFVTRRRYVQCLRWLIRERGVLICTGCGYDLRGQTEPRCPECGQPI